METAASPEASLAPPRHIAIIMDGNGRWAGSRGLPRAVGHQRGADSVRTAVKACAELGVAYLTLYAFSSENWKRPAAEVQDLMGLLRLYLRRELNELANNNVRLRVIGDIDALDPDIQDLIDDAEERTRDNRGLTLTVALNYGGRNEIVSAVRAVAERVASGQIEPDAITADYFASFLQTQGTPDPDLLIRTSGEHRLSNFLLWQSAYSELVFTPVLWPDFGREELERSIVEFQRRERRYGGTGD
ncbi:MAG: isoprenyl transferase [Alphaproteobacteria bacterium]